MLVDEIAGPLDVLDSPVDLVMVVASVAVAELLSKESERDAVSVPSSTSTTEPLRPTLSVPPSTLTALPACNVVPSITATLARGSSTAVYACPPTTIVAVGRLEAAPATLITALRILLPIGLAVGVALPTTMSWPSGSTLYVSRLRPDELPLPNVVLLGLLGLLDYRLLTVPATLALLVRSFAVVGSFAEGSPVDSVLPVDCCWSSIFRLNRLRRRIARGPRY